MSFLKNTLNLYLSSLDFIEVTAEVAREPTLNFLVLFLNDDLAADEPFSNFYIFGYVRKTLSNVFCFFRSRIIEYFMDVNMYNNV